jgi:hypothetical protein
MGFDYTKKTQELSEKIKTEAKKLADEKTADLDKRRDQLVESTELIEKFFNQPIASKDHLTKLLDDGDYEQHAKLKQQEEERQELLRQVREQRNQAIQEAEQQQNKRLEQIRKEQAEILFQKAPEFRDKNNQDQLEKFLKDFGYKEEQISGFIYDAKNILLAEEARKYRELMKEGVKPKPKPKSPKVTKKATGKISKPNQAQKENKVLTERFKQSGKRKDAAELYKARFLNKK